MADSFKIMFRNMRPAKKMKLVIHHKYCVDDLSKKYFYTDFDAYIAVRARKDACAFVLRKMINNFFRETLEIDQVNNKLRAQVIADLDLTGPFYEENTGSTKPNFFDDYDYGLRQYYFDIMIQITKGDNILGEP